IVKTSDLSLRINNISVNQTNLRKSVRAALEGQNYKLNNISVGKFSISATKLRESIRVALGTGTSGGIRLNEFSVNQKALVSAINKALNTEGRSSRIRVGALLSQSSLTDMRQQIRQSINQLVVNPTINPRISQARIRETQRRVG